ncbi:SNF2 family N-terminal domain-containing protein [Lipomyces tetrasporus]|uniref:SNF2 family N-terminal domain-containing protein n=1 Tax=Lipomyces tetrasporus TaxID=54092 RepID=A0AAD7VQ72_9ASCO|nr:SNF2 family N-terminal domain-containing protein [Lipomyces tetrasporus]KAJ8096835.1 SNF2 family N-terminal domain-containing protein [Lipomyces tetrasporus]
MNTTEYTISPENVSLIDLEIFTKAIRQVAFPDVAEPARKKRRLNIGISEIDIVGDVSGTSTQPVTISTGIEEYENQAVLFRNIVRLSLASDQIDKVELATLLSQIFDALVCDNSGTKTFRVPVKFQIDVSTGQLDVFGLVARSPLLFSVRISGDQALIDDVQLFNEAKSSRKVALEGSPLIVPNPVLCLRRQIGSVLATDKHELLIDFGAALPSSASPSVNAAEITIYPIFGKLLKRAFPSLIQERIDFLLPSKDLTKLYNNGQLEWIPRPKVTPIEFYRAICDHELPDAPPLIQHADLRTSLLDYQRRAVRWCLFKEGKVVSQETDALADVDEQSIEFPPWGWEEVVEANRSYWIAPELGQVCTDEKRLREDALAVARSGAKGLLAEEMGLGKSLETIALILLNKRPENEIGQPSVDLYSGDIVAKAKSTLIVTPWSIHRQWIEEFQRHAPLLSVYVYYGGTNVKNRITADVLAEYDVILTTYSTISRELHYTQKLPDRNLRGERKYELFRSPLIQLEFWRVVLDEVQLVENGVGNAAQVARTIPRFHAWGVSGTPVRNDLSDLAGLLQFLWLFPFTQGHQAKIWDRLCTDSVSFCNLFSRFCLRHTKDMVKDSISLPPQRRIVLTIPFTTVEENNYRHLFQEFLDDCVFTPDGAPARDDWDPEEELPKMSKWLGRLRQTCCHAQIGAGNRRALGGGPLRTVNDVLEAMFENAQSVVLTDERAYWMSKIQRAQLLEQAKEQDPALQLLSEALEGVRKVLAACRNQLAEELEKQRDFRKKADRRAELAKLAAKEDEDETKMEERSLLDQLEKEEEEGLKGRALAVRLRVRTFLELEHRCLFFIASIHFQKENKELEDEYYGLAEKARRELLQESESKAQKLMNTMATIAKNQEFVEIPEIESVDEFQGALESRSTINKAREICGILNEQANLLDEWREKVVSLLSQKLVDRDAEPDGEEYGESLDAQEEGFSYQEALRQAVADRNEAVNGIRNNLVEYDVGRDDQLDKRTDLAKKLLEERKMVKPAPYLGSLKLLYDELRRLASQMAFDAQEAAGSRQQRLEIEYSIANKEVENVRQVIASQKKCIEQLDKEVLFFRSIYNARIEYYKQLQQVSDGVAEFVPKEPEKLPKAAVANEIKILSRIDKGYARLRYLEHLRNSILGNTGSVPESERICVICQSPFEIGSLTVCGHQYCRECMLEWWKFHRTCPICKRHLKDRDIYNISYKPSEIRVKEEKSHMQHHGLSAARQIYSDMNEEALNKIKSIDLVGSYGSKIDMILRHMIWLREQEPNVQVVLFSQWADFLYLLGMALFRHSIKYATVERNMEQFKSNPEVMCFLLHARSQSSGLTLINATHVILCEPLFNTAIELQAISRVHRIGQTRPTTVWMYAISGTVEESVLALTTKRRLALLQQSNAPSRDGTSVRPITEAKLDISNSIELQKASGKMIGRRGEGEIVPQDELWDLFFGDSAATDTHKRVESLDVALANRDGKEMESLATDYHRQMAADAAERRATIIE